MITTDELKALFVDLYKTCDPNDGDYSMKALRTACANHVCVHSIADYGTIELSDGSVVMVVDEGDGSQYDWFWSPTFDGAREW
jgi:hypothetical protein